MSSVEESPPPENWWERWPALLAKELEGFQAHGAAVEIVHQANSQLILDAVWPIRGGIRLRIGYSNAHPFARPMVTAPDLVLARHQNPFGKVLCLLTAESGKWQPNEAVADLIAVQLPRLLAASDAHGNRDWEGAKEYEEQAPDPLSVYFNHLAELASVVMFDADHRIPAQPFGEADFLVRPRAGHERMAPDGKSIDLDSPFEAVLTKTRPSTGTWLAPDFKPPVRGPWEKTVGKWVRLPRPPIGGPEVILEAAEKVLAGGRPRLKSSPRPPLLLIAVTFEDELAYGPEGGGSGWLFIASRQPGPGAERKISLVRGLRLASDIDARSPVARDLASKSALVVGNGAIGSFVATELARAGVGTISLIDPDVVEPGNGVRWQLGSSAWGLNKSVALADFIHANYPRCKVTAYIGSVGGASVEIEEPGKLQGISFVRRLIADHDIVVDASASTECQFTLAFHCRDLGRPCVIGYATEGAVGGVVARFRSRADGCLVCLHRHWAEAVPTIPQPPVDHNGTVVLVGCNSPTFTGGAFDLQEVSLEMTRSAVGLLVGASYDAGDWGISILSLKVDGRRVPPKWEVAPIAPHPTCCGRVRV